MKYIVLLLVLSSCSLFSGPDYQPDITSVKTMEAVYEDSVRTGLEAVNALDKLVNDPKVTINTTVKQWFNDRITASRTRLSANDAKFVELTTQHLALLEERGENVDWKQLYVDLKGVYEQIKR